MPPENRASLGVVRAVARWLSPQLPDPLRLSIDDNGRFLLENTETGISGYSHFGSLLDEPIENGLESAIDWLLSETQDFVAEETRSMWPQPQTGRTLPLPHVARASGSLRAGFREGQRWLIYVDVPLPD